MLDVIHGASEVANIALAVIGGIGLLLIVGALIIALRDKTKRR